MEKNNRTLTNINITKKTSNNNIKSVKNIWKTKTDNLQKHENNKKQKKIKQTNEKQIVDIQNKKHEK